MLSLSDLRFLEAEFNRPKIEYVNRIRLLLPNFPEEVVETWFGDHPKSMEAFFGLGYENLSFARIDLTLAEIGGGAVFRQGARPIEALVDDGRITHRWLAGYITEHQTWPKAPILLDTANSAIPAGFPHELREPFHLIEGNHRVALALGGPAPLDPEMPLPFWLATVRVEAQPPFNDT